MPNQKIVVLLGSKSDWHFARRISAFFKENHFPIKCEYSVNSAHRNPEKLLKDLKIYEKSIYKIAYITIAGLSDSLSSVVAGYTINPVIACPPDIEKYGLPKIFSTIMTPKGIAVPLVPEPENAALAAAKILALSNPSLKPIIQKHMETLKEAVEKADVKLKEKKPYKIKKEHVNNDDGK
jgi:5-(carboxyamino)imidazole ribonucleotide mutase